MSKKKRPTPEPYRISEKHLPDPYKMLAQFGKAVRRHVTPAVWRTIARDVSEVRAWPLARRFR